MTGTRYYSEPIDMEGATSLRVEARMIGEPPHPPANARVWLEGTADGMDAEGKSWATEGSAIRVFPGTTHSATIHGARGVVRTVADAIAPGGRGCIDIRLTRLP